MDPATVISLIGIAIAVAIAAGLALGDPRFQRRRRRGPKGR